MKKHSQHFSKAQSLSNLLKGCFHENCEIWAENCILLTENVKKKTGVIFQKTYTHSCHYTKTHHKSRALFLKKAPTKNY